MNTAETIQTLARHQARIMGAWFLFYPGQSWLLFRPEQVVEEPLCVFPREWWDKQKEALCQTVATQHYTAS